MLTTTTVTQADLHTVPLCQVQDPDADETASRRSRRAWIRWLDWLRAFLRWLLGPWCSTGELIRQIAKLETVMAGHVVTLERLQNALDYDGPTGAHSRLYFFAAL